MAKLLIYGATGYTGRLASEHAKSIGLNFVVAGRTENKVKELADSLGAAYLFFDLEDSSAVDSALGDVLAVLNCAGPFRNTSKPLIDGCLRNSVHYLDVSAELDVYEQTLARDQEARQAGVMLLQGSGGSVAMLGCLVGFATDGFGKPVHKIETALHIAGAMSRGTAQTAAAAAANTADGCLQRVDGELVVAGNGSSTKAFDFGDGRGPVDCFAFAFPDLVTLWTATKVGNIQTFANATGEAFPTGALDDLPDGPTATQREATPYHAAATVTAADGSARRAVLRTRNGYTFTSIASVEAARRVLGGQVRPGFQTPAALFGHDFVKAVPGSSMKYVD